MTVLDYLAKLKRNLGLAFGAHFQHNLSIKMFLIVKESNYYANSKKFVLPSSLFILELIAGCHSQLNMVSKKLRHIF